MRAVDRAYEAVRTGIIAGRYLAGARLTEQEIATAVGVSRTPVREALRRLDAEGLVEFTPNLGAVVTTWSEADSDEVFDLRAMLESYSARRATLRATPNRSRSSAGSRSAASRVGRAQGRAPRAHRRTQQPVPPPPAGSVREPPARPRARRADRGAADDAHLPEVHARGPATQLPSPPRNRARAGGARPGMGCVGDALARPRGARCAQSLTR